MSRFEPIESLVAYIEDMERREALAAAVGSIPDYIWQIATGRRKASHTLAKDIERETGNKVSRFELRRDIFGDAPKQQRARAAA